MAVAVSIVPTAEAAFHVVVLMDTHSGQIKSRAKQMAS